MADQLLTHIEQAVREQFGGQDLELEVVTVWTCQRFAGLVTGVIEHRSQVCHDCEPVVIVRRRREGGIER